MNGWMNGIDDFIRIKRFFGEIYIHVVSPLGRREGLGFKEDLYIASPLGRRRGAWVQRGLVASSLGRRREVWV